MALRSWARALSTRSRKRAVIVCPGRGSYNSTELGTLKKLPFASAWKDVIESADQQCAKAGLSTITELDSATKFARGTHLEAAHASSLIYTLSVASMRAMSRAARQWEPVAIVGNSLGWYTALQLSGCVSFEQGLGLVIGTGTFQRQAGQVGGQLVYPILDDNWEASEELSAAVEDGMAVARAQGGFADLSIDLGGLMVLAGDDVGMAALKASLPPVVRGATKFPLVLPAHSAFHTPLMEPMAKAMEERAPSFSYPPTIPLVDGTGRIWRKDDDAPQADAAALREYTIGEQIRGPYHFGRSLEIALDEWDPDAVVLLGPGASLGGAIGQVISRHGWRGIRSKEQFAAAQASSAPVLLTPGDPK
jgi:[acyl-carrier-protein] S-malonyltransferase